MTESDFILFGGHSFRNTVHSKLKIDSKAPKEYLNPNWHHNFSCLLLTAFSIKNLN